MRAVSKEEAKNTKERLQRWAESGKLPHGCHIGEWVFGSSKTPAEVEARKVKESLTPGAFQKDWNTPAKFPACPDSTDEDALREYASRLACGEVFSRNRFGASLVRVSEVSSSGLLSIVSSMESNPIKQWAVAQVSVGDNGIIHQSIGSFFTLEGAVKAHCEQLGVPWKEYCDHHELPWGESIDDYC
jgi:hypothetical protein